MKSLRRVAVGLAAVALFAVCTTGGAAPVLMPAPTSIDTNSGQLTLTGKWSVEWSTCSGPMLERAFERLEEDYFRRTGVPASSDSTVRVAVRCKAAARTLEAMQAEAYTLNIASEGIRIDADGPTGVLRALATVRQLISLESGEPQLPFVSVNDRPRFAWRGVMLDPARHFLKVQTLKRQIDAMERVKLNVLHLHLSDDQGFRVESKRWPRLHEVASHGEFYSQEEIRELIAYAADRGVLIVPEFDVPGHSRAIVAAYPNLGATAAKARPPFPPDVALNPSSPAVYRFLEQLIEEMSRLFPGPYLHIGGDEVSDAVWADNAEIDAWMQRERLASKQDVEGYFARRVIAMVQAAGKTPIGWEEIAGAEIPKDAVVQGWQTSNATAAATAKGHRTIVSAGYYLDLLMPADFHYAVDPLDSSAAGFSPEEAQRIRNLHPLMAQLLPDAKVAKPLPPLTADQERLVLGGEAALWGETLTDEMLDHHLWPRAAALAERFWSPANVRDPADMYRRLAVIHDQLTIAGLVGDNNRRRMAARMVPGDAEPVHTLLDIVTPVRNMAHDHRILAAVRGQRIVQPFNALADAAPVDSLVAQAFVSSARKYIGGEASLEPLLRAQLSSWRDNDARFAPIARGNAMLEPALPTSASIASLARAGLQALDVLSKRTITPGQSWEEIEATLAQAEAHDAASRLPLASFLGKHPPADLIIAITPGIRALVDKARVLAPASAAIGMTDQPCPPPLAAPESVKEFNALFLEPGAPNVLRLLALSKQPEFVAYNEARKQREAQDWAGLCRYQADNAALVANKQRPDVVFLGDSITESWVPGDPSVFSSKRIGRGISGQTTAQMLVRFPADVIALHPRVVHIMAGTNDVAGNAGPTSERAFQDNIQAMVALARAHNIRVVIGSIPPAAKFNWRPEVQPAKQIVKLNAWLKEYATRLGLRYVDYYSVLATADGALKPALSIDGVHPNRDGYAAMRSLAATVR
jgi:hexosaminidase